MSAQVFQTRTERNDAILATRGIPLYFGRWKYSSWTKTQLLDAIRLLGGTNLREDTRLGLWDRLQRLRPALLPLSQRELLQLSWVRKHGQMGVAASVLQPSSLTSHGYDNDDTQTTHATSSALPPNPHTCEVCYEDITISDTRLTRAITKTCKHSPHISICRPCVEGYINSQIASNGWDNISCPEAGCHEKLAYSDIHNLASSADFERYDEHLLHKMMSEGAKGGYLRCAQTNCSGGGWCDPSVDSFMTCPICSRTTCVGCNKPYHIGKTCAEHEEDTRLLNEKEIAARAADVAKSDKYVKKHAKACPNKKCGYQIEKRGGCDHMTCTRCGHEFCWVCLASYRGARGVWNIGNRAHRSNCRYYS